MILKSMTLENFRQFKGQNNRIVFSTDISKNITLILGDNTSGKTTLLQAFLWCLYGKKSVAFTSKELLNSEVLETSTKLDKPPIVQVVLEIEHNEIRYTITRTTYYNNLLSGLTEGETKFQITYKKPNGTTGEIKENQTAQKKDEKKVNLINEIIPSELSSYFFYDTERFGNVTTKTDVMEAVKSLLGLSVLENFMDHLGTEGRSKTVIGRLVSNINYSSKDDTDKALKEITRIENSLKSKNNLKEEINKNIDHLRIKMDDISNKLRDLQDTMKLQNEKERLIHNIKSKEQDLENNYKSFINQFRTNVDSYMSTPLMKSAKSFLDEQEVSDKGIKDITASSIRELIKRGRCLCGHPLIDGEEAYAHVLQELKFVPPESIGNLIRHYIEKTDIRIKSSTGYFINIDNSYKSILKYKNELDDLEDEVSEIEKDLKGTNQGRDFQNELDEIKKTIALAEDQKELTIKEIATLEQSKLIQEQILEKNIGVNEKNKEMLTYLAYARELLKWVKNRYQNREEEIRSKLEDRVNHYFKQIYHGSRKVVIDDKYRVSLITTISDQEVKTDESQGLETVKNFSFITGLVDLAKEKINDTNEMNETDGEQYPLVLDAPFSNTDEKHVLNIARVLPTVAAQLVLVVMSKDWNYAQESMSNKVGKKYILQKKSEVVTSIVEVEI